MVSNPGKIKFGLGARIMLLVLSLVVLVMGVTSYFSIIQEEQVKLQEMDKRMTDVANMVAALKLIEPLAGETVAWPVFREFIKVVRNLDANILYIAIVGKDSAVMAYTLNPATAASLDSKLEGIDESEGTLSRLMKYTFPGTHTARISGDIVVEDRPIATVEVRFSLLGLNREIMLAKVRNILLTLIMLAMGFGGAFWVARTVTQPIEALTDAMAKVAQGDLGVSAPIRRKDEIGLLTESFNLMVQDLKEKVRIKGAFDAVADELKEVEKVREAFQQYILKEVQERFVDLSGLTPEEKDSAKHAVVVLFADLGQVAQVASTQDAATLGQALEQYFRKFLSILFEYEGQIYKFADNLFTVVFGVPRGHSDDDRRAILTAVNVQKSLAEINKGRIQRGEPALFISLGVAAGEASASLLTPQGLASVQVMRDYMSFTQKMSNQPFSVVLVAGDLFRKVTNLVRGEKVEDLQLPDSGETLEVYRITGAKF